MTDPEDLQSYLHENIPIADAMGVRVLVANDAEVELSAPLEPNVNHHMTAFGGSVAAVGILASWTWLRRRLTNHGDDDTLVIQRASVEYLEPITQDFSFVCRGADLTEFFVNFDRRGVARIELESHAVIDGRVMSRVVGSFVAKRSRKPI